MDTVEEGALTFDGAAFDLLREPDAVQWLDSERFVVANEGDYHGGSRGFTIFSKHGAVLYESGAAFDHLLARAGHYPEGRSANKGGETERSEEHTYETKSPMRSSYAVICMKKTKSTRK